MWLVRVVIRRYIDILIIIINFAYSTCIRSFFGSSILTSMFIFKCFFGLIYIYQRNAPANSSKWGSLRLAPINLYTCIYIHVWVCVTSSTLRTWRAVVGNIRWRIVGVMFLPSIFEDRCGDFRRSMYRLSKIDDRCHDVSTFEDRCVDLRRSMC